MLYVQMIICTYFNGVLAAVISDSFHVHLPIFPPNLSRRSGRRKRAHPSFLYSKKGIYSFIIPRVVFGSLLPSTGCSRSALPPFHSSPPSLPPSSILNELSFLFFLVLMIYCFAGWLGGWVLGPGLSF